MLAAIGTPGTGVSTTTAVLDLLERLRSIASAELISAYFRYDGTKVQGSSKAEVKLFPHKTEKAVWWYSVTPVKDYAFVRHPLVESCVLEEPARLDGEAQPDAAYWRWIAPVFPGRIYLVEACPNIKVDFLVYGYRPGALLKRFS